MMGLAPLPLGPHWEAQICLTSMGFVCREEGGGTWSSVLVLAALEFLFPFLEEEDIW